MSLRALALLMLLVAPAWAAPSGSIHGQIFDAHGAPVRGARVTVYDARYSAGEVRDPAGTARTGGAGRYVVGGLAAGRYSLTVVSDGHPAEIIGVLDVAVGAAVAAPIATVGEGGVTLAGTVTGPDGKPLAGARLSAVASAMNGSMFPALTDGAGHYHLTLRAGTYAVNAEHPAFAFVTRYPEVSADRVLDIRLRTPRVVLPSARASALVRAALVPLRAVAPRDPLGDLTALDDAIGGATVVGLGEANHGTREVFQVKHRLFRYLVERKGFEVLAMEATLPQAEAVNDYVLTGRGDPAELVDGLGFWIWDTEEVLDLVRWMREYNADASHATKVRFAGMDAQDQVPFGVELRRYLGRVDPETVARFEPLLSGLESNASVATWPRGLVEELSTMIAARREPYSARSSAADWRHADLYARNVLRIDERMRKFGLASSQVREVWMAENVARLADDGPVKVAVWAHNEHVALWDNEGDYLGMGAHLRRRFGALYVPIGTFFSQGSFRARGYQGGAVGPVHTYTVRSAPAWSLEGVLGATGVPVFALDVRATTGPLRGWLSCEVKAARTTGAVFLDETHLVRAFVPAESFDVIVFMDRVSASVPSPQGIKRGETVAPRR